MRDITPVKTHMSRIKIRHNSFFLKIRLNLVNMLKSFMFFVWSQLFNLVTTHVTTQGLSCDVKKQL